MIDKLPIVEGDANASQAVPCEAPIVDRESLRIAIVTHLETIGLNGDGLASALSKDAIRHIHRFHREAAQQRIRKALAKKADYLLEEIANGGEIEADNIRPELVPVRSGQATGDLFRFATLLWSIPVSQGYGRRLRYLVRDQTNGKLIGIFALGDPVFNLRVRDKWIGWDVGDRRERLVNVMDAYVVGAVPPYSDLLGGKLVTSLIASAEVANRFDARYGTSTGLISKRQKNARLALVTVTSALGRSSMYNRLKLVDNTGVQSKETLVELLRLGTTAGFGHFQLTGDLFVQLRRMLQEDGHKYADGHQFGDGPNWRIRVARIGLEALGLKANAILNHGIEREVYAMPIARNVRRFLRGIEQEATFDHLTVSQIAALARNRWIVPRSLRRPNYKEFRRENLRDVLSGGG